MLQDTSSLQVRWTRRISRASKYHQAPSSQQNSNDRNILASALPAPHQAHRHVPDAKGHQRLALHDPFRPLRPALARAREGLHAPPAHELREEAHALCDSESPSDACTPAGRQRAPETPERTEEGDASTHTNAGLRRTS